MANSKRTSKLILDTTDAGRKAFIDGVSCEVVGTFLSGGDHGARYTRVKLLDTWHNCHQPGDVVDYGSQYVEYVLAE